MVVTLPITAEGQITLQDELLQHIGVKHGGQVEVTKSLDGELRIKAKQPSHSISHVFGALKQQAGDTVLTVDEMNAVIADSWAGK